MQLTDFKVLTFDCYGTLIDWETGIIENLRPLTSRVDPPLSRDDILQAPCPPRSRTAARDAHAPLQQASRRRLQATCRRVANARRVGRLSGLWQDSVKDWPAFPDSAEALKYLKKFYRLVILSNVDNGSFSHSRRKLEGDFDAVYTAEDIGSYKPSLRNFDYMLGKLEGLGIAKSEILHTAESLFHDHAPANQVGLASCCGFIADTISRVSAPR